MNVRMPVRIPMINKEVVAIVGPLNAKTKITEYEKYGRIDGPMGVTNGVVATPWIV